MNTSCDYFKALLVGEYPHEVCAFYNERVDQCMHVESRHFGERCPTKGKKESQ